MVTMQTPSEGKMSLELIKKIQNLQNKSVVDLKKIWRELLNTEPNGNNPSYLISRITYRMQELHFGGLSDSTKQKIASFTKEMEKPICQRRLFKGLLTGMEIIREWKGVEHHVRVLDDGFEYQRTKYKSLSAIAKIITGKHWNGWAFFDPKGKLRNTEVIG